MLDIMVRWRRDHVWLPQETQPSYIEQLMETRSESLDVPTDYSLLINFITKSTFY